MKARGYKLFTFFTVPDPPTLSSFLSQLIEVFTAIVGKLGNIFALFVDEPILIFLAGLMFTGAVVSFAMRILHRN